MLPKVSVIIPVYNVERYLNQCLDSVINQTLKEIEIICVDDGSTDSCPQILDNYAEYDTRIKVIHKQNTGYGNTMNIGLKSAQGEYIGIVESDDFADLNMFEKMYNTIVTHDADLVKSNYLLFSEVGEEFAEILSGFKYDTVFSPADEQRILFVTSSIWSGLYRRSFLLDNDIKFNETSGASFQDTSFAFKALACAKRMVLLKDAFLHYRTSNMESSTNSHKMFCICDEFQEIERFLERHPQKYEQFAELEFALKFKRYFWNYNRLIFAFKYSFLMRMSEEFKYAKKQGHIYTRYLSDQECELLLKLLADTEDFLKNTKDYRDDRLINYTLNTQIYKQAFFDYISRYKNIIIYGAGAIGKIVAQTLKKRNVDIVSFAVTDLKGNPAELMGTPVKCIKDLCHYKENSVVLVATKECLQYDIIKVLKSLGFINIISIDNILIKDMLGQQ